MSSKLRRSVGTTQAPSPMLDICRNSHWERIEESFGEGPYLIPRMGLAFVNGFQGDDLTKGVVATTKHFAGYTGRTEDKKVFFEETLLPHEATVRLEMYKVLWLATIPLMVFLVLQIKSF